MPSYVICFARPRSLNLLDSINNNQNIAWNKEIYLLIMEVCLLLAIIEKEVWIFEWAIVKRF